MTLKVDIIINNKWRFHILNLRRHNVVYLEHYHHFVWCTNEHGTSLNIKRILWPHFLNRFYIGQYWNEILHQHWGITFSQYCSSTGKTYFAILLPLFTMLLLLLFAILVFNLKFFQYNANISVILAFPYKRFRINIHINCPA